MALSLSGCSSRGSVLYSRTIQRRMLSCASVVQSHIGSSPVHIPESVQLALQVHKWNEETNMTPLVITGPKGSLKADIPGFARLNLVNDGRKLEVSVDDAKEKVQRQMWGTIRSLIQNNVSGVTEGHMVLMHFVGTGYRAELLNNGKRISVKVGQSGVNLFDVPDGISVRNPQPTRLIIEGIDKQQISQYAAKIRALKPPEPYKGKGIYVNGEKVRLKDKKVK
ncbi:ribosomal protein L6, alpha-beta domain-containing protein [Dipodascopsis uninucleata]